MQEKKETCAYPGCNETETLYDLTPFNWPEGSSISACNEHYDDVARDLLEDGAILDSDYGK